MIAMQARWLDDEELARIEPLVPRGRRGADMREERRALARLPARVRALHDSLLPFIRVSAGAVAADVRGPDWA